MTSRIHLYERSRWQISRNAAIALAGGLFAFALGACVPANAQAPAAPAQPTAAAVPAATRPAEAVLKISAPTAGSALPAGSVKVAINYTGPTLVPGAEAKKLDDFHLHYLLDEDPTQFISAPKPIPTGNPRIIHSAAKEVTFDDVGPGSHTVAVVLSGNNHIPVSPPLYDSARFTAQ